jgi:hypothetical protein
MSQRPTSRRTRQFLARGDDIAFYPYDASPGGFRAMKAMLDSDDSDRDEEGSVPGTAILYQKKLSDQPLPNAWTDKDPILRKSGLRISMPTTVRAAVDARKAIFECNGFPPSRGQFSRQVEVLKDLGFGDETIILEALAQANGNVQLAAKLLQRHACN